MIGIDPAIDAVRAMDSAKQVLDSASYMLYRFTSVIHNETSHSWDIKAYSGVDIIEIEIDDTSGKVKKLVANPTNKI